MNLDDAVQIRPAERDRALDCDSPTWPTIAPDGWEFASGALRRVIDDVTPAPLEELVLRFPSAPIHGLQRLHWHHATFPTSENFHTFRILRSPRPEDSARPVSRIFMMHTGLNERDKMGLYYRLASQLIKGDPCTVCIVRPFPGHLTRYPFQGYAETPLDNYLWDGAHLFRQFMRFMLETQWFFSALVRRSSYRCASGANLLGESNNIDESRLDDGILADQMLTAWSDLHDASIKTAEGENDGSSPAVNPERPSRQQFLDIVRALRGTLHLERDYPRRGGDLGDTPSDPDVHVVGYSLGGFTAQSVFMSWPFLVSSCSTLLAGGALRELAPTGFADPEEWQTVLHSLRYELDDRLMSPHLGIGESSIAGIERELFTYFKRTFYEVFQQEYRGSIQTRLEAFRQRMLFVVGGDDPVVRPETVLQSGPKGGVNLLEIGGLGHFLDGEHQQAFWISEMAQLIHRFSDSAADELHDTRPNTWFDDNLARPSKPRSATLRPLSPPELIAINNDGALPEELFERCLDDALHRLGAGDGLLFVLRNEIPTVLLHPTAVREAAAALYHDDLGIADYCRGVDARRRVLMDHLDRIAIVLPWNAAQVMKSMDFQRGYPSQAESAGGRVAGRLKPDRVWDDALRRCYEVVQSKRGRESIRRFDGNRQFVATSEDQEKLLAHARDLIHDRTLNQIPSLPDCWVWVHKDLLTIPAADTPDVREGIEGLTRAVPQICKSPSRVLDVLRREQLRIIDVSRARYNPRFRGRLVVDGRAARRRLTHVALCLSQSQTIRGIPRNEVFS